jgi:hypothetical protein
MSHGGGAGGGSYGAGGAVDQFVGVAASPEHANVTDGSRGTGNGADHFSHVKGRVYRTCEREITASQPARRKGEDGWVHDTCPPVWD